jgi:ATP-dependent DNA ligase
VNLPVQPPVSPMLAKLTRELPRADGMFYEPKWDGFRCIVFRDGDEIELGSRNEKLLTRYFPELIEPLGRDLPPRCVLDGEVVIAGPSGLDFDLLSQRIHPAESRIKMLAATTPASFVAFDILALDDRDLRDVPYAERRGILETALGSASPPIHLTPVTDDPDVAGEWFSHFEGAGLDGLIAKPGDLRYLPDKRAMLKVKHDRTADCVVAGFRWHKAGGVVGSLLLGRGARTRLGSRSGPSSAVRSPTTTCKRSGSATPRRSNGGAPTASRDRAPTPSSKRPCPSSSPRCSPLSPSAEPLGPLGEGGRTQVLAHAGESGRWAAPCERRNAR